MCLALLLGALPDLVCAQTIERSIPVPAEGRIVVRNRDGRVSVTASDEQTEKVLLKAESPGLPVAEGDLKIVSGDGTLEVEARARGEQNRIDLALTIPPRMRVHVVTDAGAVNLVGNFREAAAETTTGTIRADVPLDALSFNFLWTASRPRFFSDVELPKVKEKAGGRYQIAGRMGDEKAKKEERMRLDFTTARGVILFGVDPDRVPADLRERPLTEAARAIVASGNDNLIEAVRKVSPNLFRAYVRELPPHKGAAPTLVERRRNDETAPADATQAVRINASVTDANGRAISGLSAADFTVLENGTTRPVMDVTPTSAPFNLVLILDVSGSVEERLEFIRKAGLAFVRTASAQDRIAIIAFRDDVQLVSDFTTDRALLIDRLQQIDAGGATALYDALAYALVHTLKPLRNERTAIVVLSDGDDNKSFVPFPAVLESLVETGTVVYPLYIPSGLIPASSVPAATKTIDPTRARYLTLTTRAEEEGRQLASVSGGVYYSIKSFDDLQRAFTDVVNQLRTSYTITYASGLNGARERRVKVRVGRAGAFVRLSPAVEVAATQGMSENGKQE